MAATIPRHIAVGESELIMYGHPDGSDEIPPIDEAAADIHAHHSIHGGGGGMGGHD